jgi:hypothetical protein
VKTIISGPANAADPLAADTEAADLINAFEGVELDEEAQAEIYRTLEACAERRRALADDPESDPERVYVGEAEAGPWLGELESGVEGDWVEYRPEACPEQGRGREHLWENLGEGGEAGRIDDVVAGIHARRAAMTPEELAAEAEAARAAVEAQRAKQNVPPRPEPDPDDPRFDWRNWDEAGYTPPAALTAHPEALQGPAPSPVRPEPVEGLPSDPLRNGEGDHVEHGGGAAPSPVRPEPVEAPSPAHPEAAEGAPDAPALTQVRDPGPSPPAQKRAYKKRQPKPPFTPPDEARKAQAVAEVEAERREAAAAEAERRKARARRG